MSARFSSVGSSTNSDRWSGVNKCTEGARGPDRGSVKNCNKDNVATFCVGHGRFCLCAGSMRVYAKNDPGGLQLSQRVQQSDVALFCAGCWCSTVRIQCSEKEDPHLVQDTDAAMCGSNAVKKKIRMPLRKAKSEARGSDLSSVSRCA